jgi:tetratricopeptide (TPR) repeat protein
MRPIIRKRTIVTMLFLALLIPAHAAHAAKKSAANNEALSRDVENLKKNPHDNALREKIIKSALASRPAPEIPEEAERNMARGTAFAQRASDSAGYKKAIAEFDAASNSAPWLALAYFNLGVVQEKAGLYHEAIQSLNFYLMAAPNAKNAREVKNKIYALEADAEDVQAGQNAPAPVTAPAAPQTGDGKSLALSGKPSLEIEPERPLKIIKMPQDKKARMMNFVGSWYFKETNHGEEVTIHAFDIGKNSNGDLVVTPPKRVADSYATVNIFEIADKKLKLQMKWKMKSVVGYWKTETYDLTMSDDGLKLAGSHNQSSVGGRNIDMDRVLFRQ